MTTMVPTMVNGRWQLLLPDHRAARPEWPWWEATRLAAMHHVITRLVAAWELGRHQSDRPVVLDVGAEEGDFPALWSTWGANVMLAEPNPLAWPNIAAIFTANHLVEPLVAFAGFLAEHHGDTTEATDALEVLSWPACADGPVVGDHGFCQLGQRPDRPQTTVDWLCDHTSVVPDVITMDVEGAELMVLRGAELQLVRRHPHVFVSIHPDAMDEPYALDQGVQRVREWMATCGYPWAEHVHLATDHEQHWWFPGDDQAVTR